MRQILWWTIKRDKEPLRSYSEGAKLGVPISLAMKTAAPIVALSARFNEADDENVRRGLAALPAMLDKVDAWIAAGVLDGEQLNAADFQIAPSLGLAMTLDDLRPAIESRPAGALAKRVVPELPRQDPADPAARLAAAAARRRPRRGLAQSEPARWTRWPGPSAVCGIGKARPHRAAPELGIELEQRGEDEAAAGDLGVGQGEALGGELEVAEQEQVDVERARAVAGGVEGAAALGLDLLAEVEQGFGLQLGADADRGVEEVGLVEHLADRLGLIGRGDRLDLHPALAQHLDRRPQVGLAVADVGAESEVAGAD